MILYRDIFKIAFRTSWRHKYLWFFGLFAALLGGSGDMEMIIRGHGGDPGEALFPGIRSMAETGLFSQAALLNIKSLVLENPFGLFMLLTALLVILSLSLFLVWISITSQAALVTNSAKDRLGKGHNFREGLAAGMKNFWPVFWVNALFRILTALVFVLLSWPIMLSLQRSTELWPSLAFVAGFMVFVPFSIAVSFIAKYAVAYVVLRGSRVRESIKEAWRLFSRNWLVSLEMAFILFLLHFVVWALLVLFLLALMVPFFLVLALAVNFSLAYLYGLILMIMVLIMVSLIAIVGSMLACFQIASWTGLFIELESRGGVSKLVRIFGNSKI